MDSDVEVQVVSSDAIRTGVWRLRYEVFIRERHWAPPEADHVGRRLRDALDAHSVVVAAVDRHTQAVVGTARTTLLCDGSAAPYPTLYRLTDLSAGTSAVCSISTFLAVAGTHRRRGLGAELSRLLYEARISRGMKFDYLDCPTEVVPYFLRFGYRWLRAIRHPWAGASHLMQLALHDRDHLIAVHSPLVVPRKQKTT